MSVTDYPELAQFLGAYFHQDWVLEAKSADEVINRFKSTEDGKRIGQVAEEINQLVARQLSDIELQQFLEALGCQYYYQDDGFTPRTWLRHVGEQLKDPNRS